MSGLQNAKLAGVTGRVAPAVPLLQKLRERLPDACIAGGFIRDAVLEEEPKDVDIFVTGYPRQNRFIGALISAGLSDVDGHMSQSVQYMKMFGEKDRVITGICEYKAGELLPWPVQIIAMEKPCDLRTTLSEFDIGLCQVGYDGSSIVATPAFLHDFNNNRMTIMRRRNDKCYARTLRRLRRFLDKYSTLDREFQVWTVVDLVTGEPLKAARHVPEKEIFNAGVDTEQSDSITDDDVHGEEPENFTLSTS